MSALNGIVSLDTKLFQEHCSCTMCGATSGDAWETEPQRTAFLSLGSRFWDVAESDLPALDLATLCDECSEGVAGLRSSGVKRN